MVAKKDSSENKLVDDCDFKKHMRRRIQIRKEINRLEWELAKEDEARKDEEHS